MNPLYKALTGSQNALSQPQQMQANNLSPAPMNGLQGIVERAKQMMQTMQNPQQAIRQFIPGLPENIAQDPNAIINWLQQTGRVNPQMIQTAQQLQQMMGGR